jgi:hypothetical protein
LLNKVLKNLLYNTNKYYYRYIAAIVCTTCSKYQISFDNPFPITQAPVLVVRGTVAGSGCAQLTLSCPTGSATVVYSDGSSSPIAGVVVVDCNNNVAWIVDGGTSNVIGFYCTVTGKYTIVHKKVFNVII